MQRRTSASHGARAAAVRHGMVGGTIAACMGACVHGPSHEFELAVPMPVPIVTTKTVTLAALDIDTKRLPDLTAVGAKTMPALMDTFDDSLDACCMDCHVRDDAKAATVEKRIAHEMWTHYARELSTADGGAVYCDSCHQGQLRFLDRSDTRALSAWMQANYVDKLRLRDGSRVECATCHGRPFEPRIFQNLWSARNG